MSESLWLIPLFFVAIAAGFFLGRRESKRRQRRRMASLSKDYVAGINFFLNEEPDKGIEALLKGLNVGEEALDTHLSLGKLFRKRGEFDRAAQLHTHLLEHGNFRARCRKKSSWNWPRTIWPAASLTWPNRCCWKCWTRTATRKKRSAHGW